MKQSFISIAILIIILVATVYFVSKAMRYKTEREKSAIKKSFIAYLLTDSLLISWLVYRKNDPNDHLYKADYNFRFAVLVSGRACGRHAPTRKLWKHAGAENQNKRGLCVSGYFPLGRSPLFACYDFLKKDV